MVLRKGFWWLRMFKIFPPVETKENIKDCGFLYKRLTTNLWLCRFYASKKKHPILYHVVIPVYFRGSYHDFD
jgi:hypothetical protein